MSSSGGCSCNDTYTFTEIYEVNTTDYLPHYARLWNPDNPVYRRNGWVSANSSVMSSLEQWMEIDLGIRMQVTGFTMQGVKTPEGDR